ncbi:PREDICTED: renin receptor-like [Priapulus caudatus]|uniref:Renin receptor-like n=1 Tax=Priapulus caudatus TaxID=37621 RepID=A0ABM1DUX3_PRICU|nr:PREDICTED: renin receptor-like [Priapulus caudatus]
MATSVNFSFRPAIHLILLSLIFCSYQANANQQVYIVHSPKYMSFDSKAGAISPRQLSQLNAVALGIGASSEDFSWKGLKSGNPFHLPEASIVVLLENFQELDIDYSGQAFPLEKDGSNVDFSGLEEELKTMFVGQTPLVLELAPEHSVMDIHSEDQQLFTDVPADLEAAKKLLTGSRSILLDLSPVDLGLLNLTVAADQAFLAEMQIVTEFGRALKRNKQSLKDGVPDLMVITLSSIRHVVKHHGLQSLQLHNALTLLRMTLYELGQSLELVYGDNYLHETVTLDTSGGELPLVRKARSLLEVVAGGDLNLASAYSQSFAPIFNIILWTSIVLALAVFAVSYGIWVMDPGRDSVIYRMTSQRIKKDQ